MRRSIAAIIRIWGRIPSVPHVFVFCYEALSPAPDLWITIGSVPVRTQSAVTTTFSMLGSEGTLYIMPVMTCSITLRRPRAPIFISMALSAMAPSASGSNSSCTPS